MATASCATNTCPPDSCTSDSGPCLGYVSGIVAAARAKLQYVRGLCPEFTKLSEPAVVHDASGGTSFVMSYQVARVYLCDIRHTCYDASHEL
jgi:hypothetical protein